VPVLGTPVVQTPSTCGDGLIIGSTNSINRKFTSPMTLVLFATRDCSCAARLEIMGGPCTPRADHAKRFFQLRVVLAVTASHRCLHNCFDEDGLRRRQHNERSSLTSWILSRHHLHTVLTTCLLSPPCCHHYQKLLTSDLIPLIRYPKPFQRE
jgi:hypothetical protein